MKRITKLTPTLGVGGLRNVEYEVKQCEARGEKMVGREEFMEGRGREEELIEVDDKKIPTLGVGGLRDDEYEVKYCEGTPL